MAAAPGPGSDGAGGTEPDGRAGDAPLPAAVLAQLEPFINPVYLKPETWPKVASAFTEEGSVQLQRLLRPDLAERVHAAVTATDNADGFLTSSDDVPRFRGYDAGVDEGWEPVGPAFKQRYLRYAGGAAAASGAEDGAAAKGAGAGKDLPGPLLQHILQDLLATTAFKALLRKVCFGVFMFF